MVGLLTCALTGLLVSPVSSFTAHPYFHDKLPYDQKDLIPIARISTTVVAVSSASTMAENRTRESFRIRCSPNLSTPGLSFEGAGIGLIG